MSSVWIEQVDKGLIDEIYSTIKVRDSSGSLVQLKDKSKQVLIRKPEEAFKPEAYPCISIYNTEARFSPIRDNPNDIRHYNEGILTLEKRAVPYELMYNIDFWAKYQTDMNEMLKSWLLNHHRQFNLLVVDEGGVEASVNCLKKVDPKKADLVSDGKRLFHTTISYCMWVEIKDETRYNTDVVTKVSINVSQSQQ